MTMLPVLPDLSLCPLSASLAALSGESETLVVGVYFFLVVYRGD
jgi:hypothetical protein